MCIRDRVFLQYFKKICRIHDSEFPDSISGQLFCLLPQEKIQFLFIFKIVKQQRFGYAAFVSNFRHRRLLIGIPGKYLVGGVDNLLLFFFR